MDFLNEFEYGSKKLDKNLFENVEKEEDKIKDDELLKGLMNYYNF